MSDQLRTSLPYLIGIPLVLLVLALRIQRMRQTRRLRVEWLWVTPALFLIITALSFAPAPPSGTETVEQERAAIDSGYTGDKVAMTDPAAAPLGSDDEAAGARMGAVLTLGNEGDVRGFGRVEGGCSGDFASAVALDGSVY